jgi:hypothetical protein
MSTGIGAHLGLVGCDLAVELGALVGALELRRLGVPDPKVGVVCKLLIAAEGPEPARINRARAVRLGERMSN